MAQKITRSIKKSEVKNKWLIVDADNVRIGKLCTKVAALLMGKKNVNNTDYLITGAKVIVINASKLTFHESKLINKFYPVHSGYPGGFKKLKFKEIVIKNPEYVIRQGVWGMIPKNKKGRKLMTNLYVFNGVEHKYNAQNPVKV